MSSHDSRDRPPIWLPRLVVTLAILVATGIAGLIPHLLGYGWFGHRVLLYGQNELYVLNLTENPGRITIDERTTRTVDPDNATIASLVGGTSSVEVHNQDGDLVERRRIETDRSHVLFDLSDQTCFVIAEVSNLSAGVPVDIKIVDLLGPDERLHQLDSRNVVWPRGYPGVLDEEATDPALSVEVLDCDLLDDPGFIENYFEERLEARM